LAAGRTGVTAPDYRIRPSPRQPRDDVFRLSPAGLEVDDPAGARTIAYGEIAELRIHWSPGRGRRPARGSCLVVPRGGRPVAFSSRHCVRANQYEARNAAFCRFVDALVRRTAAANPATRFTRGFTPGQWRGYVAVIVAVPIAIALAVAAVATGAVNASVTPQIMAVVAPAALLAAIGFPPLIRDLRHNPPRCFDPRGPAWPGLWPDVAAEERAGRP
jgi:hypothetical protein